MSELCRKCVGNVSEMCRKLDPGIPRVGFSYIFPPGSKILLIFDLRFGFLIKNCIYSQLDMSRSSNGSGRYFFSCFFENVGSNFRWFSYGGDI